MITNKQIGAGREVLRKFVADDGLRPQYHGMFAWDVAKLILEAGERAVLEEIGDEMAKAHDCNRESRDPADSCSICDTEDKPMPF